MRCGFSEKTISEWAEIFLSLEHLDSSWTDCLDKIGLLTEFPSDIFCSDFFETAFEQAIVYFIHRHLCNSMYDECFNTHVLFAVLGTYMIALAYYASLPSNDTDAALLINAARMYSAEIEYSEDNTDTLLEILQKV